MARPANNNSDLLKKSLIANVLLSIAILALIVFVFYQNQYYHQLGGTGSGQTGNTPKQSNTTNTGTLANINTPFNSTELSYINNEPLSYYEAAGELLLNGSLTNQVVVSGNLQYNALIFNGKPSVVYFGAISCIFCGENRWAMALALGKLGNFTQLFKGYSALQDGDVPTVYWVPANYTETAGVNFGAYYSSKYINFLAADFQSPITGGFQIQPISYFIQKSPNTTYTTALKFLNSTGKFQGTPFTFWGTTLVGGADGVIFGNSTPSSASNLPIAQMTHGEILKAFNSFHSQFAYSEFAAADVYIAMVCPTISESAPVCALPSITKLQKVMNLTH